MQYSWWIILLLYFYCSPAITQPLPEYDLHAVWLADKKSTPYSVFKPQEYLSASALERREQQGVPIDPKDLPISPNYISQIKQLGIAIQNKSKWLNVVIVQTKDQNKLYQLHQLPFVLKVKAVGKSRSPKPYKLYNKRAAVDSSQHIDHPYGHAALQIEQLHGDWLHQLGYTGQEVKVGIVDGGFSNAYRTAVFDRVYQENRLLGTKDFVDGDNWVYQNSTHGTTVWSTMAANIPGLMVGTAPTAHYYLFRTEDTQDEFPIEEFNWIAALEYADSVGVSIINSSLGYSVFRDSKLSYTYENMTGKGTYIAQGAAIATQKGILIVNAAGNDGNKAWKYLFAPADVTDVLTVAAVDNLGEKADFSGWGPTADGRLKPDVAALGVHTAITSIVTYGVSYSNGTSYASPVLCGLVASLKSAFPNATNQEIRTAIKASGHQAHAANVQLGYGIPDLRKAYLELAPATIWINNDNIKPSIPVVNHQLDLILEQQNTKKIYLTVNNLVGEKVLQKQLALAPNQLQKISVEQLQHLPTGIYYIDISFDDSTEAILHYKFIRY